MPTPLWAIALVILTTIIGSIGAIFLKKASSDFSIKIRFILNRNFLLGMFFYSVSIIMYLFALKFGELSVLFPTASTIYIWVSILSQKYLGEKMNGFKWFGILIILVGVALLAIGSR